MRTRRVRGMKKYVKRAPTIKIPAMIYKAADRSVEIMFRPNRNIWSKITAQIPTEFTMPIPAAAAVPAKNAEGNGQNNGIDPITPSVPMDKKMMARHRIRSKNSAQNQADGSSRQHRQRNAAAALRSYPNDCSENHPDNGHSVGIAVIKPTPRYPFIPKAFTIVGNQNAMPYKPIIRVK